MTLTSVSELVVTEFQLRCDLVKDFVITYQPLLNNSTDTNDLDVLKQIYQSKAQETKGSLISLYQRKTQHIAQSLSNSTMVNQVEGHLVEAMDSRISRNNLYLEISYKTVEASRTDNERGISSTLILQPNVFGIGVDLKELVKKFLPD